MAHPYVIYRIHNTQGQVTNELALETSHVTYEQVMSRMNERARRWSCHTFMSAMNEPAQMVMSHINESCHTWISAHR